MRMSDWSSDVCSSDLVAKGESVAVGHGANAEAPQASALGHGARAAADGATALGFSSSAISESGVAVGNHSTSIGEGAAAVGGWADKNSNGIVDADEMTLASGAESSAFGSGAQAPGEVRTAMTTEERSVGKE